MFLVNEGCGVDMFIEPYDFCSCYSRLKALTMNSKKMCYVGTEDAGHGENSKNKRPLALIPGYLSRGTKEHGRKTQGANEI
jgi:hypothetical protein